MFAEFEPFLIKAPVPVGSRVTCDPPPVDTDADYLALVREDIPLEIPNWGLGGSMTLAEEQGNEGFVSYRRGDINLIVTSDLKFYHRFLRATRLAKRFNLMAKKDRIALFQAMLYGN